MNMFPRRLKHSYINVGKGSFNDGSPFCIEF